MYKHIFKFAIISLSILTAELISTKVADLLISHKYDVKPIRFVLISMAIITVIFYPLFTRLEDWLNRFSKRFIKAGHSFAGKYFGLILMYFTGILILLYFYTEMWYDINIFKLIAQGRFIKMF